VRVNLILSILVFQERKYCLHDNVKLVFFKKNIYKNYTHYKKKNTRTVQVNCTVQNIQKLYTHLKKKKKPNHASELHCSREQCNLLALFEWIVQFTCTVRDSASEFALFPCTVQMNCTVYANAKFKKAARSYFVNVVFWTWIVMRPISQF